jgi:UTP:GlnB (protein PII) uridylyltransferase
VTSYVVSIAMPDRPGALGLVASRIGAVGGDIVAMDIIQRAEGRVVDEFVVDLAGPHLIELLRSEVHEVDGVTLLEIRPVKKASTKEG